jgi:hypothetical protein
MKLEKVRADIVNNKNGFLNFYSGGKLKVDKCEGPSKKGFTTGTATKKRRDE